MGFKSSKVATIFILEHSKLAFSNYLSQHCLEPCFFSRQNVKHRGRGFPVIQIFILFSTSCLQGFSYAKEDRAVEHPRERQQEWSWSGKFSLLVSDFTWYSQPREHYEDGCLYRKQGDFTTIVQEVSCWVFLSLFIPYIVYCCRRVAASWRGEAGEKWPSLSPGWGRFNNYQAP